MNHPRAAVANAQNREANDEALDAMWAQVKEVISHIEPGKAKIMTTVSSTLAVCTFAASPLYCSCWWQNNNTPSLCLCHLLSIHLTCITFYMRNLALPLFFDFRMLRQRKVEKPGVAPRKDQEDYEKRRFCHAGN
jgi:hypothetical protein